ncbi:hypothetical protein VP1G_08008 [Cytospora mali]|uniref:Uncharacterized protein n=1 Tax=Cytospora mali TaxID=578113 RepID=A0A194V9U4_CYTMA|nr:hypothetical protein VP1G_08008 [Valsa mali var. pyri (nom. inval.)]
MSEGQETNNNNTTPLSYKQQLDEAAIKVKKSENNEEGGGGVVNKVVEKVVMYIPAVGNVLGKGQKEDNAPPESVSKATEAPVRPHNDIQVEEFVRDQHRSNTDDLALGKQ